MKSRFFSSICLSLITLSLFIATESVKPTVSNAQVPVASSSGPTPTAQPVCGKGGCRTVNVNTAEANAELSGWKLAVYGMITTFGALFAWLGGWLLDVSIAAFVSNMATTATAFGITAVVFNLWEVVRDFFNLIFIFSLIFIGFKIILGSNDSNTKRSIGTLIIAALLINFSLYFTQIIIDFSNVTANQIQNLMITEPYEENFIGITVGNVSSAFVDKTSLQNLPDKSKEKLSTIMGTGGGFTGAWAPFAMGFIVMIMLIVAGFIFAAGAVILLTRFIVLIFLMIISPAMMLALMLPQFKKYGEDWWHLFFRQVIVGPLYLFMLYFSYLALEGFSGLSDYTVTGVLVFFVIMIGFLVLSLVVSQKLGAYGASQAISIGKSVVQKARGVATYLPRAGTRLAVGSAASALGKGFASWHAKDKEKTSSFGRGIRRVLNATNLDRSIKRTLKAGETAKFGLAHSHKDNVDYGRERKRETTAKQGVVGREVAIAQGIKVAEMTAGQDVLDAESKKAIENFGNAVKNLSEKDLTENLDLTSVLQNQQFAVNLTEKQVEVIEKSGNYSKEEVASIKQARSAGQVSIAEQKRNPDEKGPTSFNQKRSPSWLASRGVDEVTKMSTSVFAATAMQAHLTPEMLTAKIKSGISDEDSSAIKVALDNYLRTTINNRPRRQWSEDHRIKPWLEWSRKNTVGMRFGLESISAEATETGYSASAAGWTA